jgi:DNA-binding XRE family transcriptional regulator
MAAKVGVSRETISAWECGKTVPPLGQGTHILGVFRNAPHEARLRLAEAFGLMLAPPNPPPEQAPPEPAQPRRTATDVIRAAADDLDVAPSVVRKTLAAILARSDEAQLTVDSLRSAVAGHAAKKR